VSPVRYELGCYIPEDDTLHSHRRENLKSYTEVIQDHYKTKPDTENVSGLKLTAMKLQTLEVTELQMWHK
jgi:hypothetical protein